MKKKAEKRNEFLREALAAQFEEEIAGYEQLPEPPDNPEFEADMCNLLRLERFNRQTRGIRRFIQVAAAAVVLVVTFGFAPYAYASVFEPIVANLGTSMTRVIDYQFTVPAGAPTQLDVVYTLSEVPDQYQEAYAEVSDVSSLTGWVNDSGAEILLGQYCFSVRVSVDTENCESYQVAVGNFPGFLYTRSGYSVLVWTTERYAYTLTLHGLNMEIEDVVSMGRTMTYRSTGM